MCMFLIEVLLSNVLSKFEVSLDYLIVDSDLKAHFFSWNILPIASSFVRTSDL